ncbi:MAG: DUF2298 domain-containing protein [Chloroflexota bacterium]
MILSALAWWVASTILGAAAFPFAYRAFSRLPDRGYAISRVLGLLGAGYVLWLGASIRVLRNDLGGALAAAAIVFGLSAAATSGRWREIGSWLRAQRRSLVAMELVFLGAFALWAFVRANNPDITGTEKPMELAFLNAILRSPTFPPPDPWLSGYAVSYYYFGYVLLAFLGRVTGTAAGMAFNLGNAMWFALTALGTYALVFNLLAIRFGRPRPMASLLGPLFVLVSGNLEGVLEVMYARHWFWQTQPDGTVTSRFWTWLALPDLNQPPFAAPSWMPNRFWMWWRASRVVMDYTLAGEKVEVIDEFPFFSYLLADNHPHLLALPFVLLAITLTLQVFLAGRRGDLRLGSRRVGSRTLGRAAWVAGAILLTVSLMRGITLWVNDARGLEVLRGALATFLLGVLGILLLGGLVLLLLGHLPSFLDRGEFWLAAWLFGGLAFLNTWDFPIYLSLLLVIGWWVSRNDSLREVMQRVAGTAAGLVTAGVLFYLPWYPTFMSQAGGILPNLAFPTRLTHFLIMFGTMVLPISAWLVWKATHGWERRDRGLALRVALGLPAGLFLLSWLLAMLIGLLRPEAIALAAENLGAASVREALSAVLTRRLTTSWTALLLGSLIALGVILLGRRGKARAVQEDDRGVLDPYLAVLSGVGALLVLGPEFLYLKDLFETRMNTVFKFYFAAWILWGVVAAYVTVELWEKPGKTRAWLRAAILIPLLLGFVYTFTALWNKTAGFKPPTGRTLDGTAYLARENPDDYAAIQWMQAHVPESVIAEAVGGSYHEEFGRISAHTGLSTVLGWPWHETQWRGGSALLGPREADIRRLYETPDWNEAKAIIDQYGIDYVIVGRSEHVAYPGMILRKFDVMLEPVFQSGDLTIYAVPGAEQTP